MQPGRESVLVLTLPLLLLLSITCDIGLALNGPPCHTLPWSNWCWQLHVLSCSTQGGRSNAGRQLELSRTFASLQQAGQQAGQQCWRRPCRQELGGSQSPALNHLTSGLQHFSKWGNVVDVYFPGKGRPKRVNYCFVTFDNWRAAQRACLQSERSIAGSVSPDPHSLSTGQKGLPLLWPTQLWGRNCGGCLVCCTGHLLL